MTDRKKLPIGIDIFEKLDRSEFYYIDKTGTVSYTHLTLPTNSRV